MAWDFIQKLKTSSFFKGGSAPGLKARPKKGVQKFSPNSKTDENSAERKTVRAEKKATVTRPADEMASAILISPHISEKATYLSDKGTYVFKVGSKSNKGDLKRAVEGRYGVGVQSVRVINAPSKNRRRGSIKGTKSGFKKALVTLKLGGSIDEF